MGKDGKDDCFINCEARRCGKSSSSDWLGTYTSSTSWQKEFISHKDPIRLNQVDTIFLIVSKETARPVFHQSLVDFILWAEKDARTSIKPCMRLHRHKLKPCLANNTGKESLSLSISVVPFRALWLVELIERQVRLSMDGTLQRSSFEFSLVMLRRCKAYTFPSKRNGNKEISNTKKETLVATSLRILHTLLSTQSSRYTQQGYAHLVRKTWEWKRQRLVLIDLYLT